MCEGKGHAPGWEADCAARVLAGDVEAFDAIVEYYSSRVFTHLYRMIRNREEAEDLTQEAFLRAYRYLGNYDAERPFRNWLYTIATNLGVNAIRAKARAPHVVSFEELGAEWDETADGQTHPNAPAQVERMELRSVLGEMIARLPPVAAALVHLRYVEGHSVREVADMLGIAETAARVALHRARRRLRMWMTGEER